MAMWLYSLSVMRRAAWYSFSPSQNVRRVCHCADESGVACGEDRGLDVSDQSVVLLVEHVVHGGEADVLVGAAVAGDDVLNRATVPGLKSISMFWPVSCTLPSGIAHEGVVRILDGRRVGQPHHLKRSSRRRGPVVDSGREHQLAGRIDAQHRRVVNVGIV